MTYNINEVRERLELAFAINGTGQAKRDVAALLDDHARLVAENLLLAKGYRWQDGEWSNPQPAPDIDLEQFLTLARRWEGRYSPVPGCRATAGALDATQDCAAELRALIYDLSKSPYGELRPHDLVVESWPPRTGFQLSQPHGIKLTHKPTGTVVTCDTERSQHANRDRALEMLRIKLQLTNGEGE